MIRSNQNDIEIDVYCLANLFVDIFATSYCETIFFSLIRIAHLDIRVASGVPSCSCYQVARHFVQGWVSFILGRDPGKCKYFMVGWKSTWAMFSSLVLQVVDHLVRIAGECIDLFIIDVLVYCTYFGCIMACLTNDLCILFYSACYLD